MLLLVVVLLLLLPLLLLSPPTTITTTTTTTPATTTTSEVALESKGEEFKGDVEDKDAQVGAKSLRKVEPCTHAMHTYTPLTT